MALGEIPCLHAGMTQEFAEHSVLEGLRVIAHASVYPSMALAPCGVFTGIL